MIAQTFFDWFLPVLLIAGWAVGFVSVGGRQAVTIACAPMLCGGLLLSGIAQAMPEPTRSGFVGAAAALLVVVLCVLSVLAAMRWVRE